MCIYLLGGSDFATVEGNSRFTQYSFVRNNIHLWLRERRLHLQRSTLSLFGRAINNLTRHSLSHAGSDPAVLRDSKWSEPFSI